MSFFYKNFCLNILRWDFFFCHLAFTTEERCAFKISPIFLLHLKNATKNSKVNTQSIHTNKAKKLFEALGAKYLKNKTKKTEIDDKDFCHSLLNVLNI